MNDRPMRLLMTVDAVGGVWTYATSLAGALMPLGVETTLALLGPAPNMAQRSGLPSGVALLETGLPLDWLADGPTAVRAAGQALAALARDHDVVQLNSPTLLAGIRMPVPVVVVDHGCLATWWAATEAGPVPAAMAWQVDLACAGLMAADVVVTPTAAFADTVRRRYDLAERPVAIFNGREALPTGIAPPSAPPVLTAGRLWDRAKGTTLLDAVAARLSVPFGAAGPVRSPQGDEVVPRHLKLLGSLDQTALGRHLAARPVFVSAATFEPFGFAVLEAAQAGCPLVLTDMPAFRELWDGAASFAPAGDEAAFAHAIEMMLTDPALRAHRGRAAADRARRYTPDATATAMDALFRRLLPQRRAA